jgi:hypothetical protein
MPYVQISDPNIIDLAAWHQVINVVNQHSDSISSLTNNFGLSYSTTPDANGNWSTPFDFGSQQIIFGKHLISGTAALIDGSGTGYVLTEATPIDFPVAFSTAPAIFTTVIADTGSTGGKSRLLGVSSVDDVTVSSFTMSVSNPLNSFTNVSVYWVAFGPK